MTAHPVPDRTTSRYGGQYASCVDSQRLTDIFKESGELAVNSRDPDTAQSRFELAVETYHQLRSLPLPADVHESVSHAMAVLADVFPSQLAMNTALGICDKARRLKTIPAQLKYLYRAREALQAGLNRRDSGYDRIMSIYTQVLGHIDEAERRVRDRRGSSTR